MARATSLLKVFALLVVLPSAFAAPIGYRSESILLARRALQTHSTPSLSLRDIGSMFVDRLQQRTDADSVPAPASSPRAHVPRTPRARRAPPSDQPTITLRGIGSNIIDRIERRANPAAPRFHIPETTAKPVVSLRDVGSGIVDRLSRRARGTTTQPPAAADPKTPRSDDTSDKSKSSAPPPARRESRQPRTRSGGKSSEKREDAALPDPPPAPPNNEQLCRERIGGTAGSTYTAAECVLAGGDGWRHAEGAMCWDVTGMKSFGGAPVKGPCFKQ